MKKVFDDCDHSILFFLSEPTG